MQLIYNCQYSSDHLLSWTSFLWTLSFLFMYFHFIDLPKFEVYLSLLIMKHYVVLYSFPFSTSLMVQSKICVKFCGIWKIIVLLTIPLECLYFYCKVYHKHLNITNKRCLHNVNNRNVSFFLCLSFNCAHSKIKLLW